jgi:dipeptidase E
MNAVFLTSRLDIYFKDNQGNKTPKHFGNENKILDNFKKYIKKYDNFLFVASSENSPEITKIYSDIFFQSFRITLPFKNYLVLDGSTKDIAKELVEKADFILLCGGHVPSQNEFFNKINLKYLIKNTSAVICGASAGSMNCAKVVYSPPELEGEALNKNYLRYLNGLGLTDISIFPHWDEEVMKYETLDGLSLKNDIALVDSKVRPFIAIEDGAYILQVNKTPVLFGNAYKFENGTYYKIDKLNNMKKKFKQ